MKTILLVIAFTYVIFSLSYHYQSLKMRLKLKKSILNKELIVMDGVTFDFKNLLSRIQLILAVTEGMMNVEKILLETENKDVINLRKIMVKHIGRLPLDDNDQKVLSNAENRLKAKINEAIRFDQIKLGINLFFGIVVLFFCIILKLG